MREHWTLLSRVLLLLFLVNYGSCQCGIEHRVVGFEGDLSMRQHQLRGTIQILDDCTFQVLFETVIILLLMV